MNHLGTVELGTARLRLRRFQNGDADSCLRNWAGNGRVFQFISQTPMAPADMAAFLAGAEDAYAALTTYYWAVEEKESREVIGEIFVDDFSERNGWCELDYKLGPAFWRRGYAVEAARAVAAFLFDCVGFHRIQAKCSVQNAASEGVMQKMGMRQEGVLRSHFLRKDGLGYDDVVLYALLRNEASTKYGAPNPGGKYSACPPSGV